MNYLNLTMKKIDFEPAHEALNRFCDGDQKMNIPVKHDDDDMKISDTLLVAKYQIGNLGDKLKEARKLIDVAFHCKGAEHWADNELKMLQWLKENKEI